MGALPDSRRRNLRLQLRKEFECRSPVALRSPGVRLHRVHQAVSVGTVPFRPRPGENVAAGVSKFEGHIESVCSADAVNRRPSQLCALADRRPRLDRILMISSKRVRYPPGSQILGAFPRAMQRPKFGGVCAVATVGLPACCRIRCEGRRSQDHPRSGWNANWAGESMLIPSRTSMTVGLWRVAAPGVAINHWPLGNAADSGVLLG